MNLDDLCKELVTKFGRLPTTIAGETLTELQKATPVDTGHLRASWHIESATPDNTNIVNDADYAASVELGTDKMSPRLYTTGTLKKADRIVIASCNKVGI